jgi:hypothetical protein
MKEVVAEVFAEILEYLLDEGEVKLETYFVNGTGGTLSWTDSCS